MLQIASGLLFTLSFQGAWNRRYLIPTNPLARFFPHCVIGSGISFLDLCAGVCISSAFVARTAGVRIPAVEPNARMRCVLSKNLVYILAQISFVPSPLPCLRRLCSPSDMVSCLDYEKFVVDIIAATAPDVIRLSDTHAAKFLPFVCHPATARYIVVEFPCGPKSEPLTQMMELFSAVSTEDRAADTRFARRLYRTHEVP